MSGPPRRPRLVPGILGLSEVEYLVVSDPETPDRTAAIQGRGPSPLPYLAESARLLEAMGATHLAYPCNTAHYFLRRATRDEFPLALPLVDMIHETAMAVSAASLRCVGLLATTGTLATGLYQQVFAAQNVEMLSPSPQTGDVGDLDIDDAGRVRIEAYARFGVVRGGALQETPLRELISSLVDRLGEQEGLVMEAIVGSVGVKAGFTGGVARQLAMEAGRRLVARGAQALVLGCTELPIILTGERVTFADQTTRLVDPTAVLADRARALGGRHGIAGGLGPEATLDLLAKMDAPRDFIELQADILRATIDGLGARRDQDHLRSFAIAAPDLGEAATRLVRAGAHFIVLARSAAHVAESIATATARPVLVDGPDRRTGAQVVRYATGGHALT